MRLINNIFQVLTTENNYTIQSQNKMIAMQKNYNSYVSNPIINNLNNENQNTVAFQSNIKNDRLKRRLLEHKEKQQKLFKTYKKKWNEKGI